MKHFIQSIRGALFSSYDPTRTNVVGAIAVGVAILLIAEVAL